MGTHFIGEQIRPARASFDPAGMARGEPGVPRRFSWRGREYVVARVLRRWKTTSRCHSGSDEQYVRKHWFRIRTTGGALMSIYCDRQARSGRPKARWWLCSVTDAGDEPTKESATD
jgi:hypothetical protein